MFYQAVSIHHLERGFTMKTEILNVTGMTCGGCTGSVTNTLKAVHGVSHVTVLLSTGEATVQYDERLASPNQLKSAVTEAGYGVETPNTTLRLKPKAGCCS